MNKLSLTLLTLAFTFAFAYFGPAGLDLTSSRSGGDAAAADSADAAYFRLPAANGGELDLASYSGKPVMVMFFTETCPYCRKAGPALEKLSEEYGAKGLNVVGISIEDAPEGPLNFARDLAVSFPLAYGGMEVYRRYRAQGVPYIYLLDRGHKLYDVWEGYDESYDPAMRTSVEAVLSGK